MSVEGWVSFVAIAGFAILLWRVVSGGVGKLDAEIQKVRTDLCAEIQKVRTDLGADIAGVREDLKQTESRLSGDIRDLRKEVRDTNDRIDFLYQRAVETADRELRLVRG